MAITAAKSNREKLADLIDHMENLPPPAHEQLLVHLGSDAVIKMPEARSEEHTSELQSQ